jgi:uncharacterized membrane protein
MVNFWIEEKLWIKFKEYARDKGSNASNILRQYIVKKVKEYEKKQD